MKKLSEGFIKGAARAGDAIRTRDLENLRYCQKTAEWAELNKAPSTEQVVRHMVDCEVCMGAAAVALVQWTAQLKVSAIRGAVDAAARRLNSGN